MGGRRGRVEKFASTGRYELRCCEEWWVRGATGGGGKWGQEMLWNGGLGESEFKEKRKRRRLRQRRRREGVKEVEVEEAEGGGEKREENEER